MYVFQINLDYERDLVRKTAKGNEICEKPEIREHI